MAAMLGKAFTKPLGVDAKLFEALFRENVAIEEAFDDLAESGEFAFVAGRWLVASWKGGAGEGLLAREAAAAEGFALGTDAQDVKARLAHAQEALELAGLDFAERHRLCRAIGKDGVGPNPGALLDGNVVFAERRTQGDGVADEAAALLEIHFKL